MRLDEITKDEFRAKLKNPMIEEVRDSANVFVELAEEWKWVAEVDEEIGDDYVAWNIEAHKKHSETKVDQLLADFSLVLSKYDWPDDGVSGHVINQRDDYLLLGIQLDI